MTSPSPISHLPSSPSLLAGLRVCLLTGTLEPGGAERQLYYIVRALQHAGSKVQVLSLTQGDFWEQPILRSGVPVTWVGGSSSRLRRLLRIVREVRHTGADILQCQHFYTNFYGALTARILGIREVGAVRNNVLSELATTGKLVGNLNLRMPRILAANSQAAISTLLELGIPQGRTFFLPNVIDTTKFFPGVRDPGDGVVPVRLLAVGRLAQQKRFDRFIELVARVRHKSKLPVKGIIVGSGRRDYDLKPPLEQQAVKLGLFPDHLEFRGAVSDMGSVYRDGDVLVLTSDHEGTPNVILEAMASGLPVVSASVGGVPEIVKHGRTGYVVDGWDLDSMTDWVLKLIADREHRLLMGREARVYIESAHSLTRLPAVLAQLYEQAKNRPQNVDRHPHELSTITPALGSRERR